VEKSLQLKYHLFSLKGFGVWVLGGVPLYPSVNNNVTVFHACGTAFALSVGEKVREL
jgi:hypothetical protein